MIQSELKLFDGLPNPSVGTESGALISDCGKYRYKLWRFWDSSKPKVLFIMLNPSTADANANDPTITRCIGFAKYWGYGGIMVGNLFAYRSTDPKQLLSVENPVGDENQIHVSKMCEECQIVVCAWGNAPIFPYESFIGWDESKAHYLKLTKKGYPAHPLYLKADLEPKPYYKRK